MDYWAKIFPVLWDGFTVSVSAYALTLMFAMPLGLGIGLLADLVPALRKPITVFTWLFRGTPLLLQLYLTMYGIPLLFPIRMDRFVAGTVTFIVNYAAYYTEIFRSGLAIIQWGSGKPERFLALRSGKPSGM
jgi:polar amino acid transport system permease protein